MIDSKKLHIMRANMQMIRLIDKLLKQLVKEGRTREECQQIIALESDVVENALDIAFRE